MILRKLSEAGGVAVEYSGSELVFPVTHWLLGGHVIGTPDTTKVRQSACRIGGTEENLQPGEGEEA
eukprot:548573-Rhodomonas_salina.2